MTTALREHDGIQVFNVGPDWVATREPDKVAEWYCREYGFDDPDDAEFISDPVDLNTEHYIEAADMDKGKETLLDSIKRCLAEGYSFPLIISTEEF